MGRNRDTAKDSVSCRVVWGGDVTPVMPSLIVLTTKHWSSPSHDVMECVVGYLMTRRFDDWCAEGGICFIDFIKKTTRGMQSIKQIPCQADREGD